MFCHKSFIHIFFLSIISSSISFSANILPYKEDQILVRFSTKAGNIERTTVERNQVLSSVDAGVVKKSLKLVPGLTFVKLPQNLSVTDAISRLKNRPEILYAEPDYKIILDSTEPNDEYFSGQWALYNDGFDYATADADIDANEAWDYVTHSNIIVAVTDTGVDYGHPDLAANMWLNDAELNGDPDFDDDDNGYPDDIRGWDFVGNFEGDSDNDPNDGNFHGTHVAGIIGAVGNNGIGVTGVCWDVKMMALRMVANYSQDANSFASSAVEAIDYAINNGARVINASWHTIDNAYSQSLKDSIERADDEGVLFVASAGNDSFDTDNNPHYPATYDCNNIISVLATNFEDNLADYSNYGLTTVDLGAPGGETHSSYPPAAIYSTVPGGGYYWSSGTSMAAPHVAGACALVWSAHPGLTHLEVKDIILDTVDVLPALEGKCVSGGRLNLYKAVTSLPMPEFYIEDDVSTCVDPFDNLINYTIYYDPNGNTDTDVNIISQLPAGVIFSYASGGGSYNPNEHTVTWSISPFGPDNPGNRNLAVRVTEDVESGSTLINTCRLQGDNYLLTASETTDICCWRQIVYVDDDANDSGDGLSWDTAFEDLQDALDSVENNQCYDRLYVAAGTYKPTEDANLTAPSFALRNNIALFGHFSDETDPADRDLSNSSYDTILQGEIETGQSVQNVVTADGATGAVLDGFIVTGATVSNSHGINIYNQADISIANCKFTENFLLAMSNMAVIE
jgi:subtilisin family serine protease